MSVFVQIKHAEFDQPAIADEIGLEVKSKDSVLTIDPIPCAATTVWNCSLISSIKENSLTLTVTLQDFAHCPLRSLSTQLSFSPLHFTPELESSQILLLEPGLRLHLLLYFTKRKNFLGPIEFYEYEHLQTDSVIIQSQPPLSQIREKEHKLRRSQAGNIRKEVSTRGLLFCCGDQLDEHNIEIEDQDDRRQPPRAHQQHQLLKPGRKEERVEFYQGPCESKNLFSVCDAGSGDNKFTIIEDYYRDRK